MIIILFFFGSFFQSVCRLQRLPFQGILEALVRLQQGSTREHLHGPGTSPHGGSGDTGPSCYLPGRPSSLSSSFSPLPTSPRPGYSPPLLPDAPWEAQARPRPTLGLSPRIGSPGSCLNGASRGRGPTAVAMSMETGPVKKPPPQTSVGGCVSAAPDPKNQEGVEREQRQCQWVPQFLCEQPGRHQGAAASGGSRGLQG